MIGSTKAKKKIKQELEMNPLKIGNQELKEVQVFKHLGDFISNHLGESVHTTVTKRLGIAKLAIYEIRTVMEDRRARCIGGINLAFD